MVPVHTQYDQAETIVFPDIITLKILLSGSQTKGSVAVFEDIVEPGAGPGRHIHYHQDETFFFLEGDFIAEVGGETFHFNSGDVAFIPKGTIHAFKNVGNTRGRLRYVFTPALTIEEMFRELYRSFEENNELSVEAMSKIALKHGQEFVGPPI